MLNKLKYYRNQANLSQGQLAKATGISVRTIQNIEVGYRDINKTAAITVYILSKHLNCKIEDLLDVESVIIND